MFMGKSTNNNTNVNVNTQLYVSYSDTCMLKLGAWNNNLSLKFHPMKGVNADGIRQYAQDNTEIVSTSLTVDNATALIEGINKVIDPALENKSEGSVSVAMGTNENRKVLTIKTDGTDVYISIASGVNDQGVSVNNNILTHKFNNKDYLVNYDPTSGAGETISTNSDFINFKHKLNDIYNLSAAVPHAINYSAAIKNAYSSNKQPVSGPVYNAPVTNFNANDNMADFLPFS